MQNLDLETKNPSQKAIKEYLENNASQPLADKINNGVRIDKDGKTLINRKDLDGFWNYASKKARESKQEYVDNETVFGWAIHYFEEDSIEGTLYNIDGSKYTPPKPVSTIKTPTITTPPIKKKDPDQVSLFDFSERDSIEVTVNAVFFAGEEVVDIPFSSCTFQLVKTELGYQFVGTDPAFEGYRAERHMNDVFP